MRILISTDTFYPHVNGSSFFNQKLSRLLLSRGHDVIVLAPSSRFAHQWETRNGVRVFGVHSLPVFRHGYRYAIPFFAATSVRSVLQDFCPDILHCHSHFSPNTVALSLAKELRIPVVASNHFTPQNLLHFLHLPHWMDAWMIRKAWKNWRKTYEKFDLIVSQTSFAADLMRAEGFDNECAPPIRVVSNGVNLRRFHSAPGADREYLREKLSLPDQPFLLYVGRLEKDKCVDVLLRAMALLPSALPLSMVIAGIGTDQARLERLSDTLHLSHRVSFAGFVHDGDLPGLYSLAHAFCMPSCHELQSIATLEAMAAGLPILAADAMALPELVSDDVNGCLFEADNPQSLADSIQHLFSDPHRCIIFGKRSASIARLHDEERSIDLFEEIYRSLL